MAFFYHAVSGGFYLEAVHGRRTIFVPDPNWTARQEAFIYPTGSYSAPNKESEAPLIEVPNPKCLLPPQLELVEITEARYLTLLQAQTGGKLIQADSKGNPVAKAPAPPSKEQLAFNERHWRDAVLLSTDPLIVRHRDELEAQRTTTLSAEQYLQLQRYRADLRDWTETAGFPDAVQRPVEPEWLAELQAKGGQV